jgi:hypothetical protein
MGETPQFRLATIPWDKLPQGFDRPEAEAQMLALLEGAAQAGAISLHPGRGGMRHWHVKASLQDGDALARFLGVPRTAELAQQSVDAVLALEPTEEISDLLELCRAAWISGKQEFGLVPGDAQGAERRFRILQTVLTPEWGGGDPRTISARVFSSEGANASKILADHTGGLGAMLARLRGTGTPLQALQHFRISKFPIRVQLAGPCTVDMSLASGGFTTVSCDVTPGMTIPGEWAKRLLWSAPAAMRRVLTIENLASFELYIRQCRQPGTVVVFTGGMPAEPVLDALRVLLEPGSDGQRPALHHWGDLDEGGLNIMAYLSDSLSCSVIPHLMDEYVLCRHGTPRNYGGRLHRHMARQDSIGELAAMLHRLQLGCEQEAEGPESLPEMYSAVPGHPQQRHRPPRCG